MSQKKTRTLPLSRKDVHRAFQTGYGTLALLVTAALGDEAAADLVDYDNLIGFGRQCGDVCPGLDGEALRWAEQEPSEPRLDVLCGFLTGYWMEAVARDGLKPGLMERLLTLRAHIVLEPDSAIGSIEVAETALGSWAFSPEQRKSLASRLLQIIDAEPQYRHDATMRLRLLKDVERR